MENPSVLGYETPPGQIAMYMHVALATPLTLGTGRHCLSIAMGVNYLIWFATEGRNPVMHVSFGGGQTWGPIGNGASTGFTLLGTAATAETKTTDLVT